MSHLGSRVSALLDGHLTSAEEERLWNHVHRCHACRDLVEREGWVKTRLAQLSFGSSAAPDRLKDSLMGQRGALRPEPFPTASGPEASAAGLFASAPRARHRGLVALGGGAAGACVVGVLALGLAGPARVDPRPPATDLTGPSAPASTRTGSTRTGATQTRPTQTRPTQPAKTRTGPNQTDGRDERRRDDLGPTTTSTPLAERFVLVREKMAR